MIGSLRPLSLREHACLLWVIGSLADQKLARVLYGQSLGVLVVSGGTACMLDFVSAEVSSIADVPDGPLQVDATSYDDLGALQGEILVWVKSGVLSGMEYPWFTSEMPVEFPAPDSLRHA